MGTMDSDGGAAGHYRMPYPIRRAVDSHGPTGASLQEPGGAREMRLSFPALEGDNVHQSPSMCDS